MNDHHICHLKSKNLDSGSHIWECKFRRTQKCPFKVSTLIIDGGPHEIEWSYNPTYHSCYQDPMDSYRQKFKNVVKNELSNNFRAKYSTVYAKEKRKLLKSIVLITMTYVKGLDTIFPKRLVLDLQLTIQEEYPVHQ